jgi:hypothetical protein
MNIYIIFALKPYTRYRLFISARVRADTHTHTHTHTHILNTNIFGKLLHVQGYIKENMKKIAKDPQQ